MSARNAYVTLTLDTSKFEAAMNSAGRAITQLGISMRFAGRRFGRLNDTAGDRHIERQMRECIERRLSLVDAARKLMVASDVAAILDGAA